MKKNNAVIFIILFISAMGVLFAQENENAEQTDENVKEIEEIAKEETPKAVPEQALKGVLKLDFPLFDLPYQIDAMNTVGYGFFSGYANPSMAQSLALSQNIAASFNFGMKYFYDNVKMNERLKNIIYFGGTALSSFIFFYMPGTEGWMHEEYHRAVMTRFGVNSFNNMNLFPIGAAAVKVDSIKDDDLIRMQEESAADFIRMYEAGIEGQYLQVSRLQRDNFFYNQRLLNEIGYWFTTLNSHGYIMLSADPSSPLFKSIKEDETDTASNDFAGSDFTAWVYALFRPDEPYDDRGNHPNGENVKRYISPDDLTNDELRYLKLQVGLQFFNYVSPMMFGIRRIPLGDSGFYGNFAMRHYLTSFGFNIAAQAYMIIKPYNIIFTYHSNVNYQNYFPAIEAELIDYPLNIGKLEFYFSPRVIIGMQPKGQAFKTASPEFLGLFGLRVDFNVSRHFLPYIDFVFKTNGWVAGNEFLNANASVKLGVSMRF